MLLEMVAGDFSDDAGVSSSLFFVEKAPTATVDETTPWTLATQAINEKQLGTKKASHGPSTE